MSLALRVWWPRLIPALLVACGAAHAQDVDPAAPRPAGADEQFDLALRVGMSSSDNIRRASEDEESGSIASAGVDLGYEHHSRRVAANVDLDATYEDYSDDAFEDGMVGGVDATLQLDLVPERFTWFTQENFGQMTSDPFAPNTPANREDVNYFTTGPDFTLQFGGATSLRLGGRYSDLQYEISPIDGSQVEGTIALQRQLSSASAVSVNVEDRSYKFDDQLVNNDYDRRQTYLRYQLSGSRTNITADLGYTQIDVDGETSSGSLARLAVTRRMSSAATITLSFASQFSTAGDLFREGQDSIGVSSQSASLVGTSDPFTSRELGLSYKFERNRTAFDVGVQFDRERYETQSVFDRDLTVWRANFRRQLSAVLDFSVFALLEQQEFQSVDFDDDELRAGAILNWQIGRRLSARFQLDRFDRDSNDVLGEYTENRASIYLIWAPSLH
ncbi:MAG TPA: outer membrane beta-barrel protein [Steroidobacteraceae bacterium]|jgi:hypothetical protein|nr:outer membrane beta-barrel protein [Steroidobacteraceae bacterium]